jgi:topoisomerase-4 subunit A
VVLPAAFPNLLANGSAGIAVGMATSIPPHNVGELCDACCADQDPNATDRELLAFVPGPDFPDRRHHRRAARLIRRGLSRPAAALPPAGPLGRKRARGTWQIVVTEIPYQVQKSKLIEKIAELLTPRSCRCWATCATKAPKTSASCSSPRAARSSPKS